MKIYTKTGDGGSTALIGGARVKKDDLRIETYGTLDELNAHLGVLDTLLTDAADKAFVQRIQSNLFVIGSYLACDPQHPAQADRFRLQPKEVNELEQEIDRMTQTLSLQKTFLLPGGCPASAQAHVCRTVCRRAERRMVSLNEAHPMRLEILAFVNRLSDYLFVLARKTNFNENVMEKKWELSW